MKEKDPECGLPVEKTATIGTSYYRAHSYYFCAESCRSWPAADLRPYVEREVSVPPAL